MEAIRVGSAVRISWPGDSVLGRIYHGKVGVVLEARGRMRRHGEEYEQLYLVDVKGRTRHAVMGEGHLDLLRPDLEPFVQSTRFALTGDDVIHGDYPEIDVATCQSCGHYDDARRKACSACGGYLG